MGCFSAPDPNLSPEEIRQITGDSFQTIMDYYPQINTLFANEIPKLQQAENQRQMIALEGIGDTPGSLALMERNQGTFDRINRQARKAGVDTDAHLVEQYTGRFHEVDKAANRELYEAMAEQDKVSGLSSALGQRAESGLDLIPQIDGGFAQMNAPLHEIYQDAAAAVKRKGALSAEQQRDVQQATRAADSARGVMRSGMSVGNEILNTQKARQAQQLFDQNTLGMAGGMLNQNVQTNVGARNALLGAASAVDAQQFGQQQARIGNRAATRFDPIQAVLGRQGFPGMTPGMGYGYAQNMAGMSQNGSMGLFDQFTTMAGSRHGVAQSGRNAQLSAQADINAGLFGMVGNLGGAAIGLNPFSWGG